jgi:RimJ/RimL family protein N-acetyltransferase
MPIQTDSYLRRAERDDLDVVVSWMEEPDFQHFLYGDAARSPKQVRAQIVSMLGRAVGHTMPGGIYLIIDSPEAGPIGLISLQKISWRNRSCSLDLYIGHEKMRNRFTTAMSVYRALEYCFDELNLHRVSAYIYAFNTPSWRLMEKAGAKRELCLQEHVSRDGAFHDMYVYGLLRTEFEALRARYARHQESFSLQSMIEGLAQDDGASAS